MQNILWSLQSLPVKMMKSIFSKVLKRPLPKPAFQVLLETATKAERFKPCSFKYNNYIFHVPDMISVVYQIQEFFIHDNFNFKTSLEQPVIYDCGANVGIASIFFSE